MISRDTAAEIRLKVLIDKIPLRTVAASYKLTPGQVIRIVENELVTPIDERFVLEPDYTIRSRKLTVDQRLEAANLICFGATLRYLAEKYGVQIRAIQHIKKNFTRSTSGQQTRPQAKHNKVLNPNLAAEARYEHYITKKPVALIAAALFVSYRRLLDAVNFVSYVPKHGIVPKDKGLRLPTKEEKQAFWLYIYGADEAFIEQATGVGHDRLMLLVSENAQE
tara:strand:- start:1505 stop:2170 length:666 start_codon:yes stop_codon:yes gene_type:complete